MHVDKAADLQMALEIAINAKIQRPGVCNAMETLLVHGEIAEAFLPKLAEQLLDKVELRGCPETCRLIPQAKPATGRRLGHRVFGLYFGDQGSAFFC